ncbi:MAG: hypothetical protein QXS20_10665 [Candidatus Thorarchaeota archaeon]
MKAVIPRPVGMLVLLTILTTTSIFGIAPAVALESNEATGMLSVLYANYLDLDGDGLDDDVLTTSMLEINQEISAMFTVELTMLTTPSGRSFVYIVTISGDYSRLWVTISWYNAALEAGIYRVSVVAIVAYQGGLGIFSCEYEFDPPGGGDPGPPLTPDAYSNVTIEP